MQYRNSELRLDQLISYLNDDKINLSPVFQRGHVWKAPTRRKLVRNIVLGRPIPAIFIYKEPSGSRYSYNVLDGKQRVESLILFIGSQRQGENDRISIPNWVKYFSHPKDRKDVNFVIDLPEGKRRFGDLGESVVRDFAEYSIPTIEITLTDETPLDEIIDLFVDINQEGEPVKRFDVVKAIGQDNPLLQSVFNLIAREETRSRDIFYKPKSNEFTRVLKSLSLIAKLPDTNGKVDRMWERFLEIVSFVRTRKHRQPVEILKSFIKTRRQRDEKAEAKVTGQELAELRKVFRFLDGSYVAGLSNTPLATDQTHFYTMVTSIVSANLLDTHDADVLRKRLLRIGDLLASPRRTGGTSNLINEYLDLSKKQTTHPGRRGDRQEKFLEMVNRISAA